MRMESMRSRDGSWSVSSIPKEPVPPEDRQHARDANGAQHYCRENDMAFEQRIVIAHEITQTEQNRAFGQTGQRIDQEETSQRQPQHAAADQHEKSNRVRPLADQQHL